MWPQGTILVTGGSGYLGQFLVADLVQSHCKVAYTYFSNKLPDPQGARSFQVNLATGEGLQECFDQLGPLTCVINTAANTNPAACEQNVEGCRAANIPTPLLDALERHVQMHGSHPFLVHLSTDHVYDGQSQFYKENTDCWPVNAYGRSKLDAEAAVQQRWPRHAILRSSIIFGPPPPHPVGRGLFLQFIDTSLAEKKPTTFFHDEWRTPTYVQDLVRACCACCALGDSLPHRVMNVGGPSRMSRLDMAMAVAKVRGYDSSLVVSGSASSAPRTCATPADISMDTSVLEQDLDLKLTPFEDALKQIFGP